MVAFELQTKASMFLMHAGGGFKGYVLYCTFEVFYFDLLINAS